MDWDQSEGQPDEGAYVHGLYIEGARWDREAGELRDSFLRDLAPQMPIVHLIAIRAQDMRKNGYYDCPVCSLVLDIFQILFDMVFVRARAPAPRKRMKQPDLHS